jgi:hypothetical protein
MRIAVMDARKIGIGVVRCLPVCDAKREYTISLLNERAAISNKSVKP